MLKKKNIVVIGCSNMEAYIASRLSELGNNVTIIDKNKNSFRILDESYTGFKLEGNGNLYSTYLNDVIAIFYGKMSDRIIVIRESSSSYSGN